ncbi:M12 family metallopeptidase [Chitinimonas naiadis]
MKPQIATLGLALAAIGHSALAANTGSNPELNTARRVETATAKIRGSDQSLTYMVVNGRAMLGDIALGRHDEVQRNGVQLPILSSRPSMSALKAGGPIVAQDNHYVGATVWTNNTLVYTIDPALNKTKRDAILAGMKLISDKTAVRFVQRTNESNYAKFVSDGGCWSYVGMSGGEQPISIGDGCEYPGIVAHEVIHALGWMHEQMRPDRDNYVRVLTENIQSGMESQFTKLQANQVDPVGGYDLDSVMHYPNWAFSKNGQPTIVPVDPKVDPNRMGQRSQISAGDIAAINKFYPAAPSNVDLKLSASASQLQFNQDKTGQLSLTLSGSDADIKSLRFTIQSDNTSLIATSGVVVQAGTGTQRQVVITPVAKASGTANINIRAIAASGKQASINVSVTVNKDQTGGNTGSAKPFNRSAKYVNGDQATLNGKTYVISVLVQGAVSPTYWVWGSYCEPVRCTAEAPFNYGGWLKISWAEVGDTGGNGGGQTKLLCDTVLDTQKQYVISTAGLRKSLVPAGDVQNAPAILWPDAGQQRWKLSRNSEGYYSLISPVSGLALDVSGGAQQAGTELIMWPQHGGQNQQFCPKQSATGYRLISRNSSLPLGAASEVDGGKVVLSNAGFNWLLSPL